MIEFLRSATGLRSSRLVDGIRHCMISHCFKKLDTGHQPLDRQDEERRPEPRLLDGWLMGSGALYLLVGIAAFSAVVLLSFVITFVPLYIHEIANLCRRSWSVLVAHLPAVGATVPLLALTFFAWRGGTSLIRHLRDTRRFLQLLARPSSVATSAREHQFPDRLRRLGRELAIAGDVDLVHDGRVYSFCYGLLRPRICVTTGLLDLLDDIELRALLLHERHHLQQRDPLRILISEVLADAMMVLPVVPVLQHRYRVAQEVAADQAAIAGCASDIPLSSALLKLVTSATSPPLPAAIGAFSVTEERIARLVYGEMATRSLSLRAWLTTLLIVSATVVTSYAGIAGMQALSAFPIECVKTLAILP